MDVNFWIRVSFLRNSLFIKGRETLNLFMLVIGGGVLCLPTAQAQFICADASSSVGGSTALGANAVSCGLNSNANGNTSLAVGTGSFAAGDNSVALGNGSNALALNAIAIGQAASAIGSNSVAIGVNSTSVDSGVAIGNSAIGFVNTIAIGDSASADGLNSSALGANSSAEGDNSVALGANAVTNEANTVSIGSVGSERRLINVAPGVNNTDAINFQQFSNGLNETLEEAKDYTDQAITGGGSNNVGGTFDPKVLGAINDKLSHQGERINSMGAMSAAAMAAAANLGNPSCKVWRDCLGHGSFAVGAGHLKGEMAGAVIYSQPVPLGRFSLGVTFADDDVATSLGMGFDF